jgi:hypothetical protein
VLFSYKSKDLFVPVRYTSFREVVRRKLYVNAVAHQDANAVSTHAAGYRREDKVVGVVDLHLKESVRLFIHDNTREFDQFFFHLVLVSCVFAQKTGGQLRYLKINDASSQTRRPEAISCERFPEGKAA